MDFEAVQVVLILLWVPFVLGYFVWYLCRRYAPKRRWKRPERIGVWDWLGLLLSVFGNDPGIGSPTARPRRTGTGIRPQAANDLPGLAVGERGVAPERGAGHGGR